MNTQALVPHMRNPRLQDVADRADVSIVTVSRVISGQQDKVARPTRDRVLKAVRELGFTVNRQAAALRGAPSHCLGILWSRGDPASNASPAHELVRRCLAREYAAFSMDHFHEAARTIHLLREFKSRRVDAVVIEADTGLLRLKQVQQWMRQFPCIVVTTSLTQARWHDTVVQDHRHALRQIAEHFHRTGRKRIALAYMDVPSQRYKLNELREHWARLGGPADAVQAIHIDLAVGASHGERFHEVMQGLLRKRLRFDALVCASDEGAAGVMAAMRRHGVKVPQDVALVGWNGADFSPFLEVPLATIRRNTHLLIDQIEKLLFNRLKSPQGPAHRVEVRSDFILRASAG